MGFFDSIGGIVGDVVGGITGGFSGGVSNASDRAAGPAPTLQGLNFTNYSQLMDQSGLNKYNIGGNSNVYSPNGQMLGNMGSAYQGLQGSDKAYQSYIDMLTGDTFNPMAAKANAQNQAYYGGMGMLGSPAAASGIMQGNMDFQMNQLAGLGTALGQQAGIRNQLLGANMDMEKMGLQKYSNDMSGLINMYSTNLNAAAGQNKSQYEAQMGIYNTRLGGINSMSGGLIGMGMSALTGGII